MSLLPISHPSENTYLNVSGHCIGTQLRVDLPSLVLWIHVGETFEQAVDSIIESLRHFSCMRTGGRFVSLGVGFLSLNLDFGVFPS